MKKTLLFIVLICFSNTAITQCYESIRFGSSHSIGKKADGTIWGWGYAFGGTLLTSNESEPFPIQIGLENQWESVYLGVSNTFAIKVDGTLWGCGSNQQGALGINSLGDFIYSFQQITTATNWVKVAPSYFFTVALKADGTIWAWGQNDSNQTGQSPASAAQLVPMQVGTDTDWVDIATNTNRTAFALKANGTIWGWGSNPTSVIVSGSGTASVSIPTQVGSDQDWVKMSVGGQHVLAQKADGTLWAWGNGTVMGLGGNPPVTNTPQQISTDTWKFFSAGNNRSFGIKSDGTLWAWGINDVGQLGDGTTSNRLLPTQIGTDTNWETVQTRNFYNTLATKTDGTVWYWGTNYYGEFGNGTNLDTNFYTTPLQNPAICVTATLSNPIFNVSNNVSLYPNPASDFVTVSYDVASANAHFGIYDLLGRKMEQIVCKETKGQLTLETQAYPSGIYMVVLQDSNRLIWQEKLIIK